MSFKNFLLNKILKTRISFVKSKLQSIFSESSRLHEGKDAKEETLKYWNDSQFIDWIQHFNISAELGKVPNYKDGGVGRAYLLDNKVIKFTDNAVEANIANMLVNNKNAPAVIHAVKKFDNVYAIVSDKYNMNFPKTLGKASDLFMAYVDDHELSEFPETEEGRKKLATDAVLHWKEGKYLIPYMQLIIDTLYSLYKNTGFFHDDAVPSNLGLNDKGDVVVSDLGPNQPKSFNPVSKLGEIQQRRERLGLPPYNSI
jgi:hypothetical protein